MSNKFGTMLGIFILFICFMFGVDLVSMQYNYTNMDALSTNISYEISKNGCLSKEIINKYKNNYDIYLYPYDSDDKKYKEGESYGYVLEKDYSPIIISNSTIKLRIQRFTIINVYQ